MHPGKYYILLQLILELVSLSLCRHLQNLDESKQLESKALESLLLVLHLMVSGSPGSMSDDNTSQRYKLMTQSPAYAEQPGLLAHREGQPDGTNRPEAMETHLVQEWLCM